MKSDLPDLDACVSPPADVAEALAATEAARGGFGSPLYYFRTIGSTNDLAARLADAGAPEGTVVASDAQTSGRGRLGRTWHSPEGAGLYVSVVVRPDGVREVEPGPPGAAPPAALPSALTLAAGVALCQAVRDTTGLAAEIKWPNDLVVRRRKLAGILAEASSRGGAVESVIVGFGVNVRAVDYPAEIAARATSIEGELGRPAARGPLLAAALVRMAEGRAALRAGQLGSVLDRWRELAPSSIGSRVEWRGPSGNLAGLTAGLDSDGALLVEAGGRAHRVVAGEVLWL